MKNVIKIAPGQCFKQKFDTTFQAKLYVLFFNSQVPEVDVKAKPQESK